MSHEVELIWMDGREEAYVCRGGLGVRRLAASRVNQ